MTSHEPAHSHVHSFLKAIEPGQPADQVQKALRQLIPEALDPSYHSVEDIRRNRAETAFNRYAVQVEPEAAQLVRTTMAKTELAFFQTAADAAEIALAPLRLLQESQKAQTNPAQATRLSITAALQGITAGEAIVYGLEHLVIQMMPHNPKAAKALSRAQATYLQNCLHTTTGLMLARNSIPTPD